MSDMFISYAREDQQFVRNLYKAFTERDKDVWIDWKDIPFTADWLAEVYAGIESSDTFLFIMSPNALSSDACSLEIAHAVKHNKRLIPILHRDVDEMEIPEVIAVPSWIPFHDLHDLNSGINLILDSINIDLDWVHTHTRLIIRAVEWENEGSDDSYLLRGIDLKEAELWLGQGDEKEPNPTILQREYISSSTQGAIKRKRITLSGISLAIVVAIVLSITAFNANKRAQKEEEISVSRELAAQTQIHLNVGDVIGAHAVAVQAHWTSPTLESKRALFALIPFIFPENLLGSHGNKVYFASFSPNGKLIATASRDHTARLWDAETGEQIAYLEDFVTLNSANFSPDGERLVTSNWAGRASIWDLEKGEVLMELIEHLDRTNDASYSPDGTRIVTASDDATARIWDADSGIEVGNLTGHSNVIVTASYSSDGMRLLTASWDCTARVWDAHSLEEVTRLEGHTYLLTSANFNFDGSRVVTTSWDRTVRVWDTETGEEQIRIDGTSIFTYASFSPDGTRIVTASRDGIVRVWDVSKQDGVSCLSELFRLEGHTGIVNTAKYSPDGKRIVTAGDDGIVLVWNVEEVEKNIFDDHQNWVTAADFSPDGNRILSSSWDGTVRVWDTISGLELTRLLSDSRIINSANYNSDGSRIVTTEREIARIWNAQNGSSIINLEGHNDLINSAIFSPNGNRIVTASSDGTVRLWNVANGNELLNKEGLSFLNYSSGLNYSSFSPDGTLIVSASDDGMVIVQDVETGERLIQLEGHLDKVQTAVFSPDGDLIVTASWDNTVRLWNAARGIEISQFLSHTDRVNYANFNSAGTQIVSAGWDGKVCVFDVQSEVEVACLDGHSDQVTSANFNHDDTLIVTASWDGTARVWQWAQNVDEALKLVEARLAMLGITLYQIEDFLGPWGITWDKGTESEEESIMIFNAVNLGRLKFEISDTGVLTFVDDEGCQHIGNLTPEKNIASGTYSNCYASPDWIGDWEAVRITE